MAATGFTPIQLYYSTTAAAAPAAGNLVTGELAINVTDGKLYYKDNGGVVRLLADRASTTPVTTLSFGTTGLTPSTATSGAITVAGTLAVANGGTGSTTASGARTNLGASTLGANVFTITNPSAITFPRFNADNTVSALNAADFRTAIGAGTSSTTGTVTSITAGTYLTGGTITTSGTIAVDATSANTASKVVARDGSGNFSAGTITATLSGNASTATTATNLAGGAFGSFPYQVSANTTTFVPGGSSGDVLIYGVVPGFAPASTLTGLNASNISTGTLANARTTASSTLIPSSIVARDASGNFTAGTITAALNGNASTATSASTATNATNATNATTATNSILASVATSATASAFKVPFANTTASTSGFYGLLQDSEATFTYNPSTNTLTAGTFSGTLAGNALTATSATTAATLLTARTINGVSFNGSANITITATATNALTLGTGLTGSSYNGSGAVTATVSYGTTAGTACQGNDSRLSDSRQATNTNTQLASLGVGTAASGTAGEIRATNNITAYYSSDRSLKENIQDVPNALDKVCSIGSKTFDWTDEYIASKGGEDGYFVQKSDFGVVAQDVQAVFPQAVRTRQDGTLAVDYEKLATLAFGAIKELVKRVEALESK
jgi:Chaperone of endosialidase